MSMSDEEQQEFRDSVSLLAPVELQSMLGDDPEQDAIINSLLGKTDKQGEAEEGGEVTHHALGAGGSEGEEGEGEGASGEAAGETAAAQAEVPETGTEVAVEVAPLDTSFLDDKYDGRLAELDAAKAEQLQKLMDGEIDAKEYSKAEAQYMRDRDALRDEKAQDAAWLGEVHEFKVSAAKQGVNYDTPEHGQALDEWVRRLAQKPENADKDGKWFLEQAHKKVLVEFDITPGAAKPAQAAAKAPEAAKKDAKPQSRAPKLDDIPPTIGKLPTAQAVDTGGEGEFAHIDRLSGIAYERAIAKLTPEQRDRYGAM